jgi:Ca-activated chloride channel family protein
MSRIGSFLIAGALALPLVPAARIRLTPTGRTGSIAGTVRSERSAPLGSVMVTIAGTTLRAVTGADGKYRIDSVPVGETRVTARMIGYRPVTLWVRVETGGLARADFTLAADPMRLEEMVVTGTGGITLRGRTSSLAPARDALRGFNTEEYKRIYENEWQSPGQHPLSTFSIDVDAASYTNIRRFVAHGELPVKDAVRVEEMINYFPYDYAAPTGEDPFSVTTELGAAPWRASHRLALIGLQSRRIPMEALPPNNLVFLLDVSGSMDQPDKLPLVKAAFRLLVNQLRAVDRVAIVVYAGAAGVVLPSTAGDRKDVILDAIENLEAGGSTAGAQGILLAYETARRNFFPEGNNRVILATDGDFNVGVSSEGELTRLIEEQREHGVFLTVLGFGVGNLKDAKMEQLADKGNGHYAYVNDIMEARKVFVQELGATLLTVAKDVKIQVEFNPAKVQAYRLIGYENRLLADEDFNNDAKDAGELGAGHAVTALYEIVPTGIPLDVKVGSVDPLKYQAPASGAGTAAPTGEWMTVKLRYKPPTDSTSRLLARTIEGESSSPSESFRFASAVAGVGMLLRGSEQAWSATYASLARLAAGAKGADRDGYRAEFVRLTETIDLLSRQRTVAARDKR